MILIVYTIYTIYTVYAVLPFNKFIWPGHLGLRYRRYGTKIGETCRVHSRLLDEQSP